MKILYVTSMLPFGPMEAFFIPEITELRRRGHEVVVVPMWPRGDVMHEDARSLLDTTVRAPLLSGRIAIDALGELFRGLAGARALAASLSGNSMRIVAKNAAVCPKGLWLASLAKSIKPDHVHAQWGATTATMAWIAHMATGVPWSFTVHRWDIAENNLLKAKAASAQFVRAISRKGAAAVERHLGPHADKVRILHMGVELPSQAQVVPGGGRPFRIITAANLLEIKGHAFLLEAVAKLAGAGREVALDLAGGGPLEPELRRLVTHLGIGGHVRFLGVLPHAELIAGLQQGRWDAGVLPSITLPDGEQEGIPVFLMEAMSCGLPVVATRTGGIPELVGQGAGILVPERDSAALAGAISALQDDESLRRALGQRGAAVVRDEFSVRAVIDAFERWLAPPYAN